MLTFVTVTALVETEAPVGHLSGGTNNLSILFGNIDGRWAGEEVKVEDTANDVVFEGALALLIAQFDIHAIRIKEEDAVGAGGAVLEVDGVVSVKVRTNGNTIRITRPHGAGDTMGETEWLSVFAETVNVGVGWEGGLETKILRLEDERVGSRIEKHFIGLLADDGEAEG